MTYEYWYVEHHIGDKIKWCYLGKYEKLPEDYKKLIHKDTQTDTQNDVNSNNLNLSFNNQIKALKKTLTIMGIASECLKNVGCLEY